MCFPPLDRFLFLGLIYSVNSTKSYSFIRCRIVVPNREAYDRFLASHSVTKDCLLSLVCRESMTTKKSMLILIEMKKSSRESREMTDSR
jgi:hypothetical protein